MKISPNVYLIAGRASNMYLCVDPDGLTLIDAGMPKEQDRVFGLVTELGYEPSDLVRLIITHADIDHAGSAAAIQAASGATVYAGAETAVLISNGRSPEHMPRVVQWVINTFVRYTAVPGSTIEIIQPNQILPVLGGLQAIPTPGHTLDHYAFYSPSTGVLFAGDEFNTREGPLQRTPTRITADANAANLSGIHLLKLSPTVIACGHGQPFSGHQASDLMQLFDTLRGNSD